MNTRISHCGLCVEVCRALVQHVAVKVHKCHKHAKENLNCSHVHYETQINPWFIKYIRCSY